MSEADFVVDNNVTTNFPGCVGLVDTFPILGFTAPNMYAPKYKGNVYKVQVVTNLVGIITNISTLYMGAESKQDFHSSL